MKQNSGGTNSPWKTGELTTQLPALDADLQADVCIVGGGISGLTTAYLLAREGRSVVVLDDGPIGGGETGRTTAHLSNAFDDRYFRKSEVHCSKGIDKARRTNRQSKQKEDSLGIDSPRALV